MVIPFRDITHEAGIGFVHVNGAYGERLMPETIGSGVAFLDYDGDGDQDLFLSISPLARPRGRERPRHALYANDGSGHFPDVTVQSGMDFQ